MMEIYLKEIDEIWFGVTCNNQQILSTAFSLSKDLAKNQLVDKLSSKTPFQIYSKPSKIAESVITSLKHIYNGNDDEKKFNLVNENLSKYAWKVLKTVDRIKPGYVASYGNIAKAAGGSPRSVGQVMGSNPYPLIIPCHRVIRSNFSLGGYSGGIRIKLELLFREKRGSNKSLKIFIGRKNLEMFPVELALKKTS